MLLFQALRCRATALLWGGMSLSALGDQLYAVALSWIAVSVFGPYAGYLTALNALVLLLGVLGIGRWADRWDQRRSMVATDLVRAAVLLAVVGAWSMAGAPSAWMLVVAVIVLSLGRAVFEPALQAFLPRVVADRALLPAANALMDTTDRSARLIGPGLIGLLAGVVPVMHFLTIDALSFICSAVALILIGRRRSLVMPPAPLAHEPVWRSIVRGVNAMRSHKLLGFVLNTTGWLNGAWVAAFYLGLPLLIEARGAVAPDFMQASPRSGLEPGGGLGAFGLVISAYGCTNLAATLVFGNRRLSTTPQFQMFCGTALVGTGMVLMGLAGMLPQGWVLPGLAASAALGAIGGPMSDIPKAVLRQTRLKPTDIAAAMRAYIALNSIGILIAMLLSPTVFAVLGPVIGVVLCGGVLIVLGAMGLVRFWTWRE